MVMEHIKDFIIQYESWQYECCGEFFKIGDIVKWPVHKDGDEYWYAAHGGAELQIEGKIIEIVALYRTTTGDFHTFRVLGERIESITDSDAAFLENEEQENTEEKQETEDFYCYIIKMEDVTVCKIKSST